MTDTPSLGATSTDATASAVVDPSTTPAAAGTAATTDAKAAPDAALGDSLLGGDAADTSVAATTASPPADAAPDYSELKLPNGMPADDPLLAGFKDVAAEHKISAAAAQALIDKILPDISGQIAALRDEPVRLATERLKGWTTEVLADPEIGGPRLAEVKTNVARAMAQYGNPDEIKAALNETGAGSNPVLIKWLNRMAMGLSEGGAVTGGKPVLTRTTAAARMYDNKSPGDVAA